MQATGPVAFVPQRLSNASLAALSGDTQAIITRIAELETALLKIAFDKDVSDLAGNPMRWSTTIAYLALGGKLEGGQRITTEAELKNS